MKHAIEPAVSVRIDPSNPGQFFACCGLLELADRLWDGAEGWFDGQGFDFFLRPAKICGDSTAPTLFSKITLCPLKNTMTELQLQRRNSVQSMRKKPSDTDELDAEKKALDSLWRESPIFLHEPFDLRLDWFLDKRAGGSIFKTWAGQQSVADIAFGIHDALQASDWIAIPPEDWLVKSTGADCLPFNFDSNLATVGSDLDLGFSLDPLKSTKSSRIQVRTRPMLEFLAFIGLQRFRPMEIDGNRPRRQRRYRFATWINPLVPQIAATAASSLVGSQVSRAFEFRLLYRTEYLKSFLPATPVGG